MEDGLTKEFRPFLMPKYKGVDCVDVVNINKEIYEATQRLSEGSKKLFKYAGRKAEAEKAYTREFALEIMKLKIEGLAITLIRDIAKGNISDKKFDMDLADTEWTAARSSLDAIQTQISGLQTIYKHQAEI